MVGRRDVGADLACTVESNGCRRENRMVPSFSGWSICSRQKRGNGIGKTKVGKGTKVMMVSDGNGVPIGLYLDSAQHHEIRLAEATLKTVRVPQRRGRPRTRPKELVADKAYDSRSFRIWLRRRGIKPTIPTIQRKSRKPRRGRPIRVGEGYRRRWIIERCFGWMNNYRRLVVRYDRYLHIYRAFCLIAFIIWCVNRILK